MFNINKIAIIVLAIASFPANTKAEDNTNVGRIVVQGEAPGNGLMAQEDTPKARSSINHSAIDEHSTLTNVLQLIDLLPGVNAYSTEGTGLFGGQGGVGMRVRGFASDQMGVTVDGVPVNDAGNFSFYSAEVGLDPENLEEIFITQGTTDIDAPHIGAVGGNIGITTSNPVDKTRFQVQQTFGSLNARKTFVRVDTGYLHNQFFKAYLSYSESQADKWKGRGQADSKRFNSRATFDLGSGNSVNVDLLWNRLLANGIRDLTLAQIATLGRTADFGTAPPQHLTGPSPLKEVPPADSYYGFRLNPYETYIATIKGNFQLSPTLHLDVEPYYFYAFGTGGNQLRTLTESNAGSQFGGGIRDINGNGTTGDTVMVFSSAFQDNYRPGINSRLSKQIDNQKLSLGLWYEYARELRTQPAEAFNNAGGGIDPWFKNGPFILNQDGTLYQGRHYLTIRETLI